MPNGSTPRHRADFVEFRDRRHEAMPGQGFHLLKRRTFSRARWTAAPVQNPPRILRLRHPSFWKEAAAALQFHLFRKQRGDRQFPRARLVRGLDDSPPSLPRRRIGRRSQRRLPDNGLPSQLSFAAKKLARPAKRHQGGALCHLGVNHEHAAASRRGDLSLHEHGYSVRRAWGPRSAAAPWSPTAALVRDCVPEANPAAA